MSGIELVRAGESGFEQACASWNARIQHQPDAVVRPKSAEQVAAAVVYAVENQLAVRAQATGHGACRPAMGGLLVDTSLLDGVAVDPGTATALISAGTRWRDVIEAAYPHGLAPMSGTSSDVGAIGYSLGGGTGWFVRRYGLACDAITAAQVVTADGRLRWVDGETEPDLFWALRGGGPNFGVVTAVQMGLVPHPEVYGGHLLWPVERFTDVVTAWRDWLAGVPVELSSSAMVLHAPEAPFVPEPVRGKSFISVMLCYAGDPAEGKRLTEPLHNIDGLAMAQIGPLPYTRIDEIAQDPVDPLPHTVWATMLSTLDDATIAELAGVAPRGAEPYTLLEIRHVGGGARPGPDRLGLANWSGDFMLAAISVAPEPAALAATEEMHGRFDALFAGVSTGLTPMNFTDGPARVARSFRPEHLARLRAIKQEYDPAGVFGGDRSIN